MFLLPTATAPPSDRPWVPTGPQGVPGNTLSQSAHVARKERGGGQQAQGMACPPGHRWWAGTARCCLHVEHRPQFFLVLGAGQAGEKGREAAFLGTELQHGEVLCTPDKDSTWLCGEAAVGMAWAPCWTAEEVQGPQGAAWGQQTHPMEVLKMQRLWEGGSRGPEGNPAGRQAEEGEVCLRGSPHLSQLWPARGRPRTQAASGDAIAGELGLLGVEGSPSPRASPRQHVHSGSGMHASSEPRICR